MVGKKATTTSDINDCRTPIFKTAFTALSYTFLSQVIAQRNVFCDVYKLSEAKMSKNETPFRDSSDNDSPFQFTSVDGGAEISFEVRTIKGDRQTKIAQFGKFEMVCDEGKSLGGDDTAPPPLAYFAASIAF